MGIQRSNTGAIVLALALPPLAYLGWRTWHSNAATTTQPAPGPPGQPVQPAQSAPVPVQSAHPPLGRRLTTSTVQPTGRVSPTDEELLGQARQIDPEITLDELAAARLIASERGDVGTTAEWCCIVDVELNRAHRAGSALYTSLTRGASFGVQGRERPASTRQDAHEGHLAAARAVFSGEARGISRGAVRFFDPADADRAAARYHAWLANPAHNPPVARACDALTILERWSFGFPFKPGSGMCELERSRIGSDNEPQAWVGPIAGVDAWRLMLFAPLDAADPHHLATYQEARALITRAGKAVA
jgi:hypothetical protein